MKRIFRLILLTQIIGFLFHTTVTAQVGGEGTYDFLNMPNSARVAAMGGNFLAIDDNDITITVNNPSLINPELNNNLGLSYINYFSGINYGFATYSRTFDEIGSFTTTIQFMNYGKFEEYDETNTHIGEFTANEVALGIGWGRELTPHFSIGSNLRFIYSDFYIANSFGIAVDVAGSYIHDESQFVASLIARNVGIQITKYDKGNSEPIPFELQLGLSKGLKHLPFRFSVLFNHLNKWDLRYDDPLEERVDPITGEEKSKSWIEKSSDELLRHIVIGGEMTIAKFINVRIGYNYKKRKELAVKERPSTVGISWGVGVRISKFHVSYSRSRYHLEGSPNFITITTNLSDFHKAN